MTNLIAKIPSTGCGGLRLLPALYFPSNTINTFGVQVTGKTQFDVFRRTF